MSKDVVSAGQLDRAKRRALVLFDSWQRVTGALDGSSWEWEVRGIVEDAVEIGIQEAMGVYRQLDAEKDLQSAVGNLQLQLSTLTAAHEALKAERDRYREALENIVGSCEASSVRRSVVVRLHSIAAAALASPDETPQPKGD